MIKYIVEVSKFLITIAVEKLRVLLFFMSQIIDSVDARIDDNKIAPTADAGKALRPISTPWHDSRTWING